MWGKGGRKRYDRRGSDAPRYAVFGAMTSVETHLVCLDGRQSPAQETPSLPLIASTAYANTPYPRAHTHLGAGPLLHHTLKSRDLASLLSCLSIQRRDTSSGLGIDRNGHRRPITVCLGIVSLPCLSSSVIQFQPWSSQRNVPTQPCCKYVRPSKFDHPTARIAPPLPDTQSPCPLGRTSASTAAAVALFGLAFPSPPSSRVLRLHCIPCPGPRPLLPTTMASVSVGTQTTVRDLRLLDSLSESNSPAPGMQM